MDKNKDIRDKKDSPAQMNSAIVSNVFISDREFELIFKKTDRIVTALYLVTNFFIKDEELKNEIRQVSNKLLRGTVSFNTAPHHEKENRLHTICAHILEMNSLFDISYRTGLVSNMNYEILHNEIDKLSNDISTYKQAKIIQCNSLLSADMFTVSLTNKDYDSRPSSDQIKDKITLPFYKGQTKPESVFYGTVKDLKDKLNFGHSRNTSNVQQKDKKTNANSTRREQIISQITKKGEVSVKDISEVIKDCSEKTLQRELLALVAEGVLLKIGERRWSKYSIKK